MAAAAFVLGLLPLLVLAMAAYLHQRRALTEGALDRLEAVASVQEARLDAYIEGSLRTLSLVSSRTQFRLSLADYVDTGNAEALSTVTRILTDARDSSVTLGAIHAIDSGGVVVASTDSGRVGVDLSAEPYFGGGLRGPTVGPIVSADDGQFVHLLSGPILLEDRLLGVVVIEAWVEPLVDLVNDYTGLGETGETLMAARTQQGDAVFIAPLRFDQGATLRRVPQGSSGSAIGLALAAEERVLGGTVDYRGERVFAATRYVEQADWGVVVKIDVAEALEPVADFGAFALGATFVVSVAVAVMVRFGAKSFSGPIRQLTETAVAVSAGDRTRRARTDREDELGALAAAFNQMTDELTAAAAILEVQAAALQQRTLQLEQSNRELQQFASVAAHDLQEPLRKVRAFGDRLVTRYGDSIPAEARMYALKMQQASERMQRLIDDVLTLSRVTTRGQPFQQVDLGLITREVVADLSMKISETGGRVEVGELPSVDADPVQMGQLLQNLIGNGLKYHRDHVPPVVTVGADGTDLPDGFCAFSVRDNGIGFGPQYADRIFEVFERLHGASEYEGTGIGLAVCRRIVERHGGWITASSVPGSGSTFVVVLPRRYVNPTEEARS